jgi:predicted TIM-barrel fold metal-dependent hydrolase
MVRRCLIALWLLAGTAIAQQVDPQLAAYIDSLQAIDNHAHVVAPDIPSDKAYDALRCDDLPPGKSLPPAMMRFGPDFQSAWKAIFGVSPASQQEAEAQRPQAVAQLHQQHPSPDWVLQQAGIAVELANRVSMSPALKPPAFRWVPYDDALLFPLNNAALKLANPERNALFNMEDELRKKYLQEAGLSQIPPTLNEYLDKVVRPTLQRQKDAGALAIKFEVAYLRQLNFGPALSRSAEGAYQRNMDGGTPFGNDYKVLQDYLFRFIAAEAGRLGMAVHIHTGLGCGEYFDTAGSDPMLLESIFNDPTLRNTNFVLLHGGSPYDRNMTALIVKPNVFVDTSVMEYMASPQEVAREIRTWLEIMPERVIFGTDSGPTAPGFGWEEALWLGSRKFRQALGIVLTQMMKDEVITETRARQIAERVLRGNAADLYRLPR